MRRQGVAATFEQDGPAQERHEAVLVQVFLGTDRIFSRTHLGGHLAGSAVQGQTLLSKEPAFLPETSPPPTPPPPKLGQRWEQEVGEDSGEDG